MGLLSAILTAAPSAAAGMAAGQQQREQTLYNRQSDADKEALQERIRREALQQSMTQFQMQQARLGSEADRTDAFHQGTLQQQRYATDQNVKDRQSRDVADRQSRFDIAKMGNDTRMTLGQMLAASRDAAAAARQDHPTATQEKWRAQMPIINYNYRKIMEDPTPLQPNELKVDRKIFSDPHSTLEMVRDGLLAGAVTPKAQQRVLHAYEFARSHLVASGRAADETIKAHMATIAMDPSQAIPAHRGALQGAGWKQADADAAEGYDPSSAPPPNGQGTGAGFPTVDFGGGHTPSHGGPDQELQSAQGALARGAPRSAVAARYKQRTGQDLP